jgi:hypothetical protein
MRVGVLGPAAVEPGDRQRTEPMLGRVEVRMLPGEDQPRGEPLQPERIGNGSELDRLGPGPDDQPDIRRMQPSP